MPQLLAMAERFWNSTQHFRRKFVNETFAKDGLPFSDPQHLLLMQAIRARDAEAAQVVVRLHIRRTRLAIEGSAGAPTRPRRGASAPRVNRLTIEKERP
jgi:DNA-binding GntR family transcriptional regulator